MRSTLIVTCFLSSALSQFGVAEAQDDAGPTVLAPLIVTGERVERSVSETPSSVFVVTGEELERRGGVQTVEDALELVPNVTSTGVQNLAPAIRGVDSTGVLSDADAFFGGSRPRATVTLDGRPLGFNEYVFGFTSVFDLERAEVFRGPQTTSQGVNSIAGATYLVTRDPTFEPEFLATGQGGRFSQAQFGAVASGPLVEDELAGRLAVEYRRANSFVDFQPTMDFADPNDFETMLVRGKLLWEPKALPDLTMKLTVNYAESQAPQTELVAAPFDDLVAANPDQAVFENASLTAIHNVSYALSDDIEISNQLSITHFEVDRFAPPGLGVAEIDTLDFVNETTLSYAALDGRLTGVFGTYLQYTDQDEAIDLSAFLGAGAFDDRSISFGAFGEATYAITDRFDATFGLRYQVDRQNRDGDVGPITVDFDKTFDAFLPKFALGYDVAEDVRVGAIVSRGFNPGGTTIFFSTGEQDTFDEETVWNFEAFARGSFMDQRLVVNANAFLSEYRDFQLATFTGFDPLGDPEFEIANADRVRTYGVEVGASFQATDALRIYGALGLLKTDIRSFSSSADPDIEGNSLPRAPTITASFGADFEVIEGLRFGGDVRISDSYFSDTDNTEAFRGDAFATVDLRASYEYEGVTAFAYLRNALDSSFVLSQFDADSAVVNRPREFGAGLTVRF